jgi:hypothetical protein
MTQLGNVMWVEKSQDDVKSSLQGVKKPALEAEETTEVRDVVTREPKAVKIVDTEEQNEGRKAKETVDEENAELGVDTASGPEMVLDEKTQTADEDIRAIKNFQNNEVESVDAKKPMLVADVKKVIETAELGKDAASVPIIVLDEATPTAVGDISIDNAEEQDCAAKVVTGDLQETADDAKKTTLAGIAEETTETCDDIASKPMMEKAEAEVPGEVTQTAVVETAAKTPLMTGVAEETTELCDDASQPEMEKAEAKEPEEVTPTTVVEIVAPKYQSTEMTAAENAEEPEDTSEYMMSKANMTEAITSGMTDRMTEAEQ